MRPARLRKGLAVCPVCGKTVLERRVVGHVDTPECIVLRTASRYAARGWVRAGTSAGVIERAGLPIERAPVALKPSGRILGPGDVMLPDGQVRGANGRIVQVEVWIIPEEGVLDGPWTPAEVLRAVKVFETARMPPEARSALVRRALEDDDFRLAVDTSRRLGGVSAIDAFVSELYRDEEDVREEARRESRRSRRCRGEQGS